MEFLGVEQFNAVQVIQTMLAPGVMINACGLLLLGVNNKYSSIAGRIRLLNEEKRKLHIKAGELQFSVEENIRLESIARQLEQLVQRAKAVRNSVLCNVIAIALFVATSILIGLTFFTRISDLSYITISAFLLGVISVITGAYFIGVDVLKGYAVVEFEVKAED